MIGFRRSDVGREGVKALQWISTKDGRGHHYSELDWKGFWGARYETVKIGGTLFSERQEVEKTWAPLAGFLFAPYLEESTRKVGQFQSAFPLVAAGTPFKKPEPTTSSGGESGMVGLVTPLIPLEKVASPPSPAPPGLPPLPLSDETLGTLFGNVAPITGLDPDLAVQFPIPWPMVGVAGTDLWSQQLFAMPAFAGLVAPHHGLSASTAVGTGVDKLAARVWDTSSPPLPVGGLDYERNAGFGTLARVWGRFTPVAPAKPPTDDSGLLAAEAAIFPDGIPFGGVSIFSGSAAIAAAAAAGIPILIPDIDSFGSTSSLKVPPASKVPAKPVPPIPKPAEPGPVGHSTILRIGRTGGPRAHGEVGFVSDMGSLDDSHKDLIAALSAKLAGIVGTGSHNDKHLVGVTPEGESVSPTHLPAHVLIRDETKLLDDEHGTNDAGWNIDLVTPWVPTTDGPYYTLVDFRYDPDSFHKKGVLSPADDPFHGGETLFEGLWRWEAHSWWKGAGGRGGTPPPDQEQPPPRRRAGKNERGLFHFDTALEFSVAAWIGKPQHYSPLQDDVRNNFPTPYETWQRDEQTPVVFRFDVIGAQRDDGWALTQIPGQSKYAGGTAPGTLMLCPPEFGAEQLQAGTTLATFVGSTSTPTLALYGANLAFGQPMGRSGAIRNGFVASQPSSTKLQLDHYGAGSGDLWIGTTSTADASIPFVCDAGAGTWTFFGSTVVTLASRAANLVLAGPSSGAAAAPTWRALVAADIPSLDASKISTGTLAQARGGTNLDTSGVTNGQLLIGNTTGNVWTRSTLTAGSNVTITNGAGSITIAAAAAGQPFTAVSPQSASFTAAAGTFYPCTATLTMTLPAASGSTAGTIATGFINTTATTTTIALTGADTLVGATSFLGSGKTRFFISDGLSTWYVVAGGN